MFFKRNRIIFVLLLLALGVAALWSLAARSADTREEKLKSHVTLYVGEPLLSKGGTVIVGSVPLPEEEWRVLDGLNLADADDGNAKRRQLGPQDRLFGAYVSGPVSYVEMYYPEGGTFGFNLVPDSKIENPARLSTERILMGSGGWMDRSTGERHVWPDVSVIHVLGSTADKGNSRLVRVMQANILNTGPDKEGYAGVLVYSPSLAQLEEGTFGDYK